MRKAQSFFRGTLILIVSGFVTKILGFVHRTVLARTLGTEGVGLCMMAFPTFVLVATLVQLGLPVAIAKLVAEANTQGDQKKIKQILLISFGTTFLLAIFFTTFLFFIVPLLGETLLTDKRTIYPILTVAPAIPIIAFSSVLRGYFQGMQNMTPISLAQVLEQIIRLLLVIFCTRLLLPYGIVYGASGAMVASVLGELTSLLYMINLFQKKKEAPLLHHFFQTIGGSNTTFKQLMEIALPTTGGRLIGALTYFFEPIIVTHSLVIAGLSQIEATKQYGELEGYALPLLLLPNFITFALATSLIPTISEALAQGKYKLVELRWQQTTRVILCVGGWAVIIMYVFATPLLELTYGQGQGAIYIRTMAPCFLFYYFQTPLHATLQASNLATPAMMNTLIGNMVKLITIYFLATRPSLQIIGAALAICAGILTTTSLHFATLMKKIQFTIHVKSYLAMFLIIPLAIFFGERVSQSITFSTHPLYQTFIQMSLTTLFYLFLCTLLKIIRWKEVKKLLK